MVTAVSGDDVDKIYTGIVADIAKLARMLAKTETYGSANGPDALQAFADHLAGIVAAVGAHPPSAIDEFARSKQAD